MSYLGALSVSTDAHSLLATGDGSCLLVCVHERIHVFTKENLTLFLSAYRCCLCFGLTNSSEADDKRLVLSYKSEPKHTELYLSFSLQKGTVEENLNRRSKD